jgi:secreted Zn-dependent insulinase-like peptidase
MLTELYVKLVNDLLTEFSYPAYLAGLDYRLYKHVRGISVRISGYDDKQDELLTQILQTLSNPVIDVVRFEQSKDEIRRDLKNAGQNPPYRQTYAEIMNLLLTPYWSDEESLAALEPLNVEDLKKFIPDLLKQVSVVALAYGNVDRDEASTLAQTLQESLLKQAEPVAVERGRLLKLDGQNNYVRQLDIDNDDSALLVYVQADDKSYANRARFALLGQILESPFFEDLRTENQLGYIVFASPMPLLEVPGLAFAVQSPIADPIELQNHVERFITSYSDTLQNMSEEEFAKHKLGLLTGILQAERTPQEKAERYWTEIDREDYGFDSRQKLAVAVEAITKNDLVATYRQALLSKPQKRLVIRSIGNRHKEKFLAKEKDLQELLIADPSAFKQDRAAFPG